MSLDISGTSPELAVAAIIAAIVMIIRKDGRVEVHGWSLTYTE